MTTVYHGWIPDADGKPGERKEVVTLDDFLEAKDEAWRGAEQAVLRSKDELIEALRNTSEQLEAALFRLGVCGPGDGQGHRADVNSWGGTTALADNRALIAKHAPK